MMGGVQIGLRHGILICCGVQMQSTSERAQRSTLECHSVDIRSDPHFRYGTVWTVCRQSLGIKAACITHPRWKWFLSIRLRIALLTVSFHRHPWEGGEIQSIALLLLHTGCKCNPLPCAKELEEERKCTPHQTQKEWHFSFERPSDFVRHSSI